MSIDLNLEKNNKLVDIFNKGLFDEVIKISKNYL